MATEAELSKVIVQILSEKYRVKLRSKSLLQRFLIVSHFPTKIICPPKLVQAKSCGSREYETFNPTMHQQEILSI